MKKFLSILLMLALLLTLTGCYNGGETEVSASEEAAVQTEQEGSRFENFLLKKGSLITKEFIDHKKLSLSDESSRLTDVMLQVATLTDLETNEVYKALRIEYTIYKSGDFVSTVIVLDADEVDSLISALKYMNKASSTNTLKDYTEIVYTSHSGASIGMYYNGGGNVFFQNNEGINSFYDAAKIPALIEALEEIKPLLVVEAAEGAEV